MRFECREMHQYLTFVVDATAPVDGTVAYRRNEGWRVPKCDRIFGLHVVMAVNEHGRGARRVQPGTVGDGKTVGFEDARVRQAGSLHAGHDGFGGAAYLEVARWVGRDRGARDPRAEFREVALAVRADELDEFFGCDHGLEFRLNYTFPSRNSAIGPRQFAATSPA